MRTHMKFFAVAVLLALTSAVLAGGLAVAVGYLLGLAPRELLLLFGNAAGTALTAVVVLAELAAQVFPMRRPDADVPGDRRDADQSPIE